MKRDGYIDLPQIMEIEDIDMIPTHIEDEEFRSSLSCHVPQQIKIIDELLKKILEYSKPRKPVIEDQNVKTIIDSIIQRIYKEESIKVIVNLPIDFYVRADEFHLRQIIFNVILNSIEALHGSGIIHIEGHEGVGNKILTI